MNYKDTYFKISKDILYLIEKGEKNFILYPFGVNGVMAKDILQSQFGLEPAYILDNKLCKVNPKIQPVTLLDTLNPDDYILLLTIENPEVIETIRHTVYSRFRKDRVLEFFPFMSCDDRRVGWLRNFAAFVHEGNFPGNVAECGVNRGDFAKYINTFFPNRICYLFDSFEGFDPEDIAIDDNFDSIGGTLARSEWFNGIGYYKSTSVDIAMAKMPYPEKIVVKKGYIPATLEGVNDEFVFINLDMDVYKPMLEALRFFYPRMVKGGVMLLHDYYEYGTLAGGVLSGVEGAVRAYEKETGISLCKIPAEVSSSLIIVKE